MAFQTLNLTRTGSGFGPNPLSLTEIKAYIDLMGSPLLPLDIFIDLILKMDRKFLELALVKQKREMNKGGRKT